MDTPPLDNMYYVHCAALGLCKRYLWHSLS